jgi:anti-sigma regulatory factor (Ser/Thr protein kinase)
MTEIIIEDNGNGIHPLEKDREDITKREPLI